MLNKSVIENASGIKMWHCLRVISDAAVKYRIKVFMEENQSERKGIQTMPILDLEEILND